jgi:hypothetical protein
LLPKTYTLTLTTIRYLGWLGEALTGHGPGGYPTANAVAEASRCCDRIEHIAQYALESMEWTSQAGFLMQDLAYMNSVLGRFESVFTRGGLVPTVKQLADLQMALTESVNKRAAQ